MSVGKLVREARLEIVGRTPAESRIYGALALALAAPAYFEPTDPSHIIASSCVVTGVALIGRSFCPYRLEASMPAIAAENFEKQA